MSLVNVDFDGSSVHATDLSSTPSAVRSSGRLNFWDVALGLGLAAFLPALFWVGLVWAVCSGVGVAISGATLATIGFSVAAFLTVVCSAMFRAG
jgi:hypothetical protein